MLIYCNGDSYAAGSELADHIFFSDHPGYSESDTTESRRYWWNNNFKRSIDRKQYSIEEKNRAWPAKLGIITGHPVINSAVTSASMEAIVTTSINDLIKLKKLRRILQQLFR